MHHAPGGSQNTMCVFLDYADITETVSLADRSPGMPLLMLWGSNLVPWQMP